MNDIYPLALEPFERELIWGGDALVRRYGKRADPNAAIGESWECWDGNRIGNGAYAGATVEELRATLGRALTGRADPAETFPLLTKIIDARRALSVQVHPDDAYARRVEGQRVGKTECWLVLEAEPGARIVLGWNRATSREEYVERLAAGTLDELLRYVPARPGDVFHLPAGTLHAIGAGIVLFEVQQASDLTYRIYDYDRPGPDGTPRELHVEKAADVLDFGASTGGALRPIGFDLDGLRRTVLVSDEKFWVERISLDSGYRGIDLEEMPLALFALDRPIDVDIRGRELRLAPYQSALVPAGADVVMVRGEAGAQAIAAAPPSDRNAVAKRLGRAGVGVGAVTDFLAQF